MLNLACIFENGNCYFRIYISHQEMQNKYRIDIKTQVFACVLYSCCIYWCNMQIMSYCVASSKLPVAVPECCCCCCCFDFAVYCDCWLLVFSACRFCLFVIGSEFHPSNKKTPPNNNTPVTCSCCCCCCCCYCWCYCFSAIALRTKGCRPSFPNA